MVSLTKIAHSALLEKLERMIAMTPDPNIRSDYSVLTGILIHGPEHRDYIWPGVMYTVVGGERHNFSLEKGEFAAAHA